MITFQKIEKISLFNDNYLILKTNDGEIRFFNQEGVNESDVVDFKVIDRYLILQKENELIFRDLHHNSEKSFQGKFFIISLLQVDNQKFLVFAKVERTKVLYIIDVENGYIKDINIQRPPHICLKKEDNALIISNSISKYNFINGDIFWEKTFASLLGTGEASLYSEIIIYNNNAYFFIFNREEDEKSTFCLDIETGDILFESKEFGGLLKLYEDKIYSVYEKEVWVLNPTDNTLVKIDLTSELQVLDENVKDDEDYNWLVPFRLSNTVYFIKNAKLYFTQSKGNKYGCIDLNNRKLLWHDAIGEKNMLIGDIKVTEKQLFILDQSNTLWSTDINSK